jgi:hypothetical protein
LSAGENPKLDEGEYVCSLCRVTGGTRAPCQPDHLLESYEKEFGRPCPRVLLHPDNFDAWRLLNLGLGEDTHGLAAAFGAGLAHYLDRQEYRRVFARVQAVRSDTRFAQLLEDHVTRTRPESSREKERDDE